MDLFNDNKTFILVGIALVGAMILMATGKIPGVISVGEFTTLSATLVGIYAAKSGIGKFAKKGDSK